MHTYSTTVDRTHLDYAIEGNTLRCSIQALPGFALSVSLEDPSLRLTPSRRFSRFFWVGIIGLVMPVFTFGMIYIKERTLHLDSAGFATYAHLFFFLAGAFLVSWFRRPVRGILVTVGKKKQGIAIWSNPRQPDTFHAFIFHLENSTISHHPQPGGGALPASQKPPS